MAETTSVRLRVYGPDGDGDGVGRHFEKQLGVAVGVGVGTGVADGLAVGDGGRVGAGGGFQYEPDREADGCGMTAVPGFTDAGAADAAGLGSGLACGVGLSVTKVWTS